MADTPVIGVLSQPLHTNFTQHSSRISNEYQTFPSNNTTRGDAQYDYIAASYIKWLEGAGARTIVIPYNASKSTLDEILTQIHMVFLPGGAAPYPESLTYLLDKLRQRPSFFPVWGTCLGFEFLVQYAGGLDILDSDYVAENVSLALEHVVLRHLYQKPRIYKTVTTTNTTLNNHHQGITPTAFLQNTNLTELWEITSLNHDANGKAFVTTIEPKPGQPSWFGVQYHPEKNAYEYATYPHTNIPFEAIDHSPTGIQFSFDMARHVVHLARLSMKRNPSHQYTLVDKYPPVYMYPIKVGTAFEQIYVISQDPQRSVVWR